MEIKKSRQVVDSPESQRKIFPFIVDYGRVQSRIAKKYGYWQREVVGEFGTVLGLPSSFRIFTFNYVLRHIHAKLLCRHFEITL